MATPSEPGGAYLQNAYDGTGQQMEARRNGAAAGQIRLDGGGDHDAEKAQMLFWGRSPSWKAVEAYSKLEDFIENSLEIYRTELSTISFPVFACIYLGLVASGLSDDAQDFMEKCGSRHDVHYLADTNKLRQIFTREQAEKDEYATALRENRFQLDLCTTSFELITGFLVNAGLSSISNILNQRVSIRKSDRPPLQHFRVAYFGAPGDVQPAPQTGAPRASPDINWGALPPHIVASALSLTQEKKAPYDAASLAASYEPAAIARPVPEGALMSMFPPAGKPQPPLPQAEVVVLVDGERKTPQSPDFYGDIFDRLVLRQLDPELLVTDTGPPVTSAPSEMDVEGASALPKPPGRLTGDAAFIADPFLPSVALATFTANPSQLSCARASHDLGLLAAGFEDSVIRVWSLKPSGGGGRSGAGNAPKHFGDTEEDGSSASAVPEAGAASQEQQQQPKQAGELYISSHEDEDESGSSGGVGPGRLVGHGKPVYSLSWSPDKRTLLSASGDGTVRLWDVKAPEAQQALVLFQVCKGNCPVWSVSFSPVGHYFATGSYDRVARMYSVESVKPLRLFVGHSGDVTSTAFHPNCHYILTGSRDKTARLWDVQTGNCVRVLFGHTAPIGCVDVSPNGRYAAAGGDDGEVRLWDLGSGRQVCVFRGHTGPVDSVVFSSEGSGLASSGCDESVRVWDVLAACAESGLAGVPSSGASGSGYSAESDRERSAKARFTFWTKATAVYDLQWSPQNLLFATGSVRSEFRRDGI